MISYHNGWKTFHMERFSTILVGFPSISSKIYPKEVVQMKVSNAFALLLSVIIENNKMYDICFIKKKTQKDKGRKSLYANIVVGNPTIKNQNVSLMVLFSVGSCLMKDYI